MRCILGLCVVLAVGNSAWTSEMSNIAGEPEYQTPAATVTSSVTQTTGTTAASTTSPAGAYQTATSQPATTTMSPAPTTMSPGTYTVGTQPVATYATPMSNTPYTTYSYPARIRGGLFGMRSPVNSYPAMPATTTYTTPAQTYTVMPGQTYYQPVRRRIGLFQRWRQQATPVYGTPVYSTSAYPAPVYTTYDYSTPAYYTTTNAAPGATPSASNMTPAGSTAPVYTPTTLDVPNGTPATGTAPAATAPAEPPLQGTTPAQAAPSPPGAGQGTTSLVPPISSNRPPLIGGRSTPGNRRVGASEVAAISSKPGGVKPSRLYDIAVWGVVHNRRLHFTVGVRPDVQGLIVGFRSAGKGATYGLVSPANPVI